MFNPLVLTKLLLIILSIFFVSCSGLSETTKANAEATLSQDDEMQVVYQYLKEHSMETGIDNPKAQLQLISRQVDDLGLLHYQFIQVVNSVPVWKNYIKVHVRDQAVYRVDGKVFAIPEKIQTKPTINTEQAEAFARQSHVGKMTSELVVLAEPGKTPILVYAIDVLKGMQREQIFINAFDGHIEKAFTNTQTLTR